MSEVVSEVLHAREIRVFLSSTFNDMDAERTHLVKEVFPRIRAACTERMVGFTEIDLRWGVTEDESKNGETIEICLAEIDRCRAFPPFFIGFLGERYGWIPNEQALQQYWAKHPGSDYAPLVRGALERGLSVTEIEMELAVLAEGAAEKLHGQVLFLLRDPSLTDAQYKAATGREPDRADRRFYEPAGGKLDALKDRLRSTPFLGIDGYRSIEEFGAAVEAYLLERLDRYFPEASAPTPLERARLEHSSFRQHRLRFFLPREVVKAQLLTAMQRRIDQSGIGPVVLVGPSGQGKSAVLADLARHLETRNDDKVHWRVIDHYVGVDGVLTLDGWQERILQMLHPELREAVGDEIPSDPEKRREALARWLTLAANQTEKDIGRPVRFALIVDALDQLLDEGKNLDLLLPDVVGPRAVVVASAADATAAVETITVRRFETVLLPALTQHEARGIIGDLLASYRKALPETLVARLVGAAQAGNPLFLQLALEELRLDARHETLDKTLDTILACEDAAELFLTCFLRDPEYQREGQSDLAIQFFALQAASYQGLTEFDLADLLALPADPIAEDTGKPRLPQLVMSKLAGVFWPFMVTKEGRRAPMHRILGKAALHELGEEAMRGRLYRHYRPGYGDAQHCFDARAAAEALFQIEQLATVTQDAWEQIRDDLEDISLPALLFQLFEGIVVKALTTLGHVEVARLARSKWVPSLSQEYSPSVNSEINFIVEFTNFLDYRGFYQAQVYLVEWAHNLIKNILDMADRNALTIKLNLSVALYRTGNYQKAEELQSGVLDLIQRLPSEKMIDEVHTMSFLVHTLKARGKFDEAIVLCQEAINTSSNKHGELHKTTLSLKSNLASILHRAGHILDAKKIMLEVIDAYRPQQSSIDCDFAVYLGDFASLTFLTGDVRSGSHMLSEALQMHLHVFGSEHPETLRVLNNIAKTRRAMNDLEGALILHQNVFRGRSKALGELHPETLGAMLDLGMTYSAMNNFDSAYEVLTKVLEKSHDAQGPLHYLSLEAMANIAQFLAERGDLEEAKILFLKFFDEVGDVIESQREHPFILDAMSNFAVVLLKQGFNESAKERLLKALKESAALYGEGGLSTISIMINLAAAHDSCGEFENATLLLTRVMELQKNNNNVEHSLTLRAMRNFFAMLLDNAYFAEAYEIQKQVCVIQSRFESQNRRQLLFDKKNLADCLYSLGNFSDAERLQFYLLSEMVDEFGSEDENTFKALRSLAMSLCSQEKYETAVKYLEHCYSGQAKNLGIFHNDTLETAIVLATAFFESGDLESAQEVAGALLEARRFAPDANFLRTRSVTELLTILTNPPQI